MPPLHSPKFPGWFFYALRHYRQNVKTNVSNAKMNIPKASKSLKSKGFLLSISTTPILCRIEASHPATRLLSQTVYHDFYLFTILFSVILNTYFSQELQINFQNIVVSRLQICYSKCVTKKNNRPQGVDLIYLAQKMPPIPVKV